LSGAFGGGGGAGGLLGTKTGDFLTWVTISLEITGFCTEQAKSQRRPQGANPPGNYNAD